MKTACKFPNLMVTDGVLVEVGVGVSFGRSANAVAVNLAAIVCSSATRVAMVSGVDVEVGVSVGVGNALAAKV
jgi:uncharacterized alkaline shock family protein YloU